MTQQAAFFKLVAPKALRKLAGDKVFDLGQAYCEAGAVHKLSMTDDGARASVHGTATYRVALRVDAGRLAAHCNCPHADDGYFCKHCVAVGLACLDDAGAPMMGATAKRQDPWSDIQRYVQAQEAEVLAALLLDVAQRDDRLYQSLLLKARHSAGGDDLAKVFRKTIDEATRTDRLQGWGDADRVARTLDDLLDAMRELLVPASATILVELLEYAIPRVEGMLEEVDDSDGDMSEALVRLGELHLDACRLAAPDPVLLAERLFKLETTLMTGICSFDPRSYRDVLGTAGLERYRKLVLAQWHTIRPRKAGDAYDPGRATVTHLMEQFAEDSGDIEQLVEIKSHDLSSSRHYLSIAELWQRAGKREQAMEWAERGVAAFPHRTDNHLYDFLAGIYLACGRSADAVQLTWRQLEEHPCLQTYQKLGGIARQAASWDTHRERALAVIDATIAARARSGGSRQQQGAGADYSMRVGIALWEGEVATAWHYANLGVCDRRLLIALAGELESKQLDDAVALYRRIVPRLVDETNNGAYEEAAGLVVKMCSALTKRQRSAEAQAYVASLRIEFKRKRNFIKMLDR